MRLHVLGSSSKGNCYLIYDNDECLIIEAGIHLKEIKKALNFDLSRVTGCLSSHLHNDHSKYIRDLMEIGINVYANKETFEHHKLGIYAHRRNIIEHGKVFNVGSFKIKAFSLCHDVPTLGFLMHSEKTGNIVFATDTYYIPYKFNNIQHIFAETNYSQSIIDNKVKSNKLPEFVRNRILKSHMSLETTKQFLKANDLSKVNNIVLLHLSGGNADPKQFKEEIEQLTYKNTFIASKGLKIDLNKEIF